MKPARLAFVALLLAGCASLGGGTASGPTGQLECLGGKNGRPTIILESGAFGGAADWSLVAERLAVRQRVCAYDRDGLGLAEIHDLDRSPVAIARRLEALIAREEGDAPVILAGHSNGGLYVEAFARLWPERTAGLVLVDAVGTDVKDHPLALADLAREERMAAFTPFARSLGLTRLIPLMDDISPAAEAAARRRRAWAGRTNIQAGLLEERAFLAGLPAVDALPPLSPTIPLAVIVASRKPQRPLDRDWRAAEVAPALRACRAVVVDAWASHTSILDAQRDYVADVVDWLNGEHPWAGVRRC
uniref:AB hydrolase-1 domain-containing protein n=1 Tax=Caulobacter sp. (strain K31) TaxID=366602 RepID=B0T3L7_CAUSK